MFCGLEFQTKVFNPLNYYLEPLVARKINADEVKSWGGHRTFDR